MKKILALILALMMVISLSLLTTSATSPETTVYISDNGNDSNDGKSASTPVKTMSQAMSVLSTGGGVIMITDVYTASAWNILTSPQASSYTIRGVSSSSQFVHGRNNIALNASITFDNLTYQIGSAVTSAGIYCQWNRLEFTDSVTMSPKSGADAESRSSYPWVLGGNSAAGDASKTSNVVLNGGTFNYVIGGCLNAAMAGNVNISVGGSANIMDTVYCGSGKSNTTGDITLDISGGSIGKIMCGGTSSGETRGDVLIRITGGTFGSIYGRGSETATLTGLLTVDMTGFPPSAADGYVASKFYDYDPAKAIFKTAVYKGLENYGVQEAIYGDGTYSVRFLTTVDSLDYESVGYIISASGNNVNTENWPMEKSCTSVYTAVLADAVPVTVEGKYFHTVVINNISVEKYDDITFTYKPFVTIDGVRYYGAEQSVVYNDGVLK